MNNKPTKLIEASKIRNKDRHPSQNELPPIDKFHPDWWYYRQEMEEPVEIDDNYKNESRHMNKKLIRLTEGDLHRIVKQSVNKVLRESLEGTDEIEEAVTNAASVIADAYHVQNGMQDIANDHDDSWYELQENLREAMLNAAMNVLNSAY